MNTFGPKKGPMIPWAAKGVPPGANNKLQGIGFSKSAAPSANKIPSMTAGIITAKVENAVKAPIPAPPTAVAKPAVPVAAFKIAPPSASSALVSKLPPSLHSSTSTMDAPPSTDSPVSTTTVTTTKAHPPSSLLSKKPSTVASPSSKPSSAVSGVSSVHKTVSSSPATTKNASSSSSVDIKEVVSPKVQSTPLLQVSLPPTTAELSFPSTKVDSTTSEVAAKEEEDEPKELPLPENGEEEIVDDVIEGGLNGDDADAAEEDVAEEAVDEDGIVNDSPSQEEPVATPSPSTTTSESKKKHKSRARPVPSFDDSESAAPIETPNEDGEVATAEEDETPVVVVVKKPRKKKAVVEQESVPVNASDEVNNDDGDETNAESSKKPTTKRPYNKKPWLDEHGKPVLDENGNPMPKPRQARTKKVKPVTGESDQQNQDASSSTNLMDVDGAGTEVATKQAKVKKPRAKKEKVPKAESSEIANNGDEVAKPPKKPRMTRKIRLQAIIDIISPHGLAWIDSDNAIRVKIPQIQEDADDLDQDPADNTDSNIAARMEEDFVAGDDDNEDDCDDEGEDDEGDGEGVVENDGPDENGNASLENVADVDPEQLLSVIDQGMDIDCTESEIPPVAAKLESGEVIMIVSAPSSAELSLANIVSGKRSRRTVLVVDPIQPHEVNTHDENGNEIDDGVEENDDGAGQHSEDESMKSDDDGDGDETYLLDEVEPNNEYFNISDEFRAALVVAVNLYTKLMTELEKAEEAKRLRAAATGLPPKKRGRPSKKQQQLLEQAQSDAKAEEDESYMEGPPATKKQKKAKQSASTKAAPSHSEDADSQDSHDGDDDE